MGLHYLSDGELRQIEAKNHTVMMVGTGAWCVAVRRRFRRRSCRFLLKAGPPVDACGGRRALAGGCWGDPASSLLMLLAQRRRPVCRSPAASDYAAAACPGGVNAHQAASAVPAGGATGEKTGSTR